MTTRRASSVAVPPGTHEWISFPDPDEDRTWLFDVTFLESTWSCIFGRGCQGVLTEPAAERNEGCCSYGAHFTDDDDVRRVEAAAADLSPEQWQFHRPLRRRDERSSVVRSTHSGQRATRIVEGACVFLNRPGFAGGAGCALHIAALSQGVPPHTRKPDVCWQLPLRREDHRDDDGHVTSVVRQWERRDWGAGGPEFHWWCTEAPEAFDGPRPVYQTMAEELVHLVGGQVYEMLVATLRVRRGGRQERPSSPARNPARAAPDVVALPHPAIRHR